ncbi:MAG TPA: helix-turn-helix domain-containing protein [Ktedonobacteraceae bacterium]
MQTEPSFRHFHVQHFCPLALALDGIGDHWSFLIVRDLLREPQRFTDLQRYLLGITPKRLTVNLRTLESAGIVKRESEAGRREVWYHLTEKGAALGPAIMALAVWSLEYNQRMPLPGERVYPEHMIGFIGASLNRRGIRLAQPASWVFFFGEKDVYTISFDGAKWEVSPTGAEHADVSVRTTPEVWANFVLSSELEERQHLLASMRVSGPEERVGELLASMRVNDV